MSGQIIDTTNQPLVTSLFQLIEKDILSQKLAANEKLTEQSLCKKYNVSRTPVREALRQLEADGLIENIPNRGSYVIGLSKRDISDLFDLRALLEIQGVEWAIKRMSDDELDELREKIEFMEFYTLKDDTEKVLNFNSQFHNLLYAGTNDRMLQKMLNTFQVYLKHSAPAKSHTGDYLKTILDEHKAIFKAIESRNIPAGRKAMEHHMKESKLRRMVEYF